MTGTSWPPGNPASGFAGADQPGLSAHGDICQCHSAVPPAVPVAGVKADFSHGGPVSSRPYDVDAASMRLERHERGIHALTGGRRAGITGHGSALAAPRHPGNAGAIPFAPDQLQIECHGNSSSRRMPASDTIVKYMFDIDEPLTGATGNGRAPMRPPPDRRRRTRATRPARQTLAGSLGPLRYEHRLMTTRAVHLRSTGLCAARSMP